MREEEEVEEIDNYKLKGPQSSGRPATIDQLQSSQAMKNLGLYTPPDGSSGPQFQAMCDRVDDWTVKMRAGGLPSRSTWLSYTSANYGAG